MASHEFRQSFGWLILFDRLVFKEISQAHDIKPMQYYVLTACYVSTQQQGESSLARKIAKYVPSNNPTNFYRCLKYLFDHGLLDRSIKTTKTGAKLYQYGVTGKGIFIIKDYDRRMKLQINLIKSTRVK